MSFLLYGCYGYTGRLIAREAIKQGLKPVLAGRNPEKTKSMAESLGLDFKVFPLENQESVVSALQEYKVVLHSAGPFSQTSKYMADACMRTGTHYLDITGEISVFEALAARDSEAKKAKIMLLPGVGFDVVPSDCLALQLKEALPDAEFLRLGFQFRGGGFSRGTARTVVEGLGLGSIIRKNGKLISIREGSMTRNMDFGNGEKKVVTTPWGDVSTAWYSTGIPNVEVYFQFPSSVITMLKLSGFVGGILQTSIIQKYLLKRIENGPEGPDENALANGQSIIVGEVENKSGQQFRAKLISAQGYKLTAATAVLAAKKVLAGNFNPGFKTPSLQFGPLFAEETGLCQVSFEK